MKAYQVVIATIYISVTLAEHPLAAIFKDTQIADDRIINGLNAQRGQFPYQVSLHEKGGGHICGGSILTQEWVLTAGHCLIVPANELIIFAGLLHQRENHPDVQTVGVRQMHVHPGFPGGAVVGPNDIALLRLSSPLKFTSAVQPISLPSENEEPTGHAVISGWGQLSGNNHNLPTTLQYVQLQILTFNQCHDLLTKGGAGNILDRNMVCVHAQGKGACPGDSGGPMVQNGKLLGVTSWGLRPCGSYPSVYTKVSSFLRFIRQFVHNV